MYRKKKVPILWSANFAYAIGIIATDGNLSPDGRHINVTSKDLEIVLAIKEAFGLSNKIGRKGRGRTKEKPYFVIQFGDINFFEFLQGIGLTSKKSKTLGALKIPIKYFSDFLRGCIDGDGSIGYFMHPESIRPQYRVRLVSASNQFLLWIRNVLHEEFRVDGGTIHKPKKSSVYTLAFAKKDSRNILQYVYNGNPTLKLKRKYLIAMGILMGE